MRRSAFIGFLLGVFVAFSAPSPSIAQEEGVTLDPNSPAAKEYDLPVDRARRDSSGSSGDRKSPSGDGSSVPFGEGIGSADGTASNSAGSAAGAQAEAEAKAKAAAKARAKAKAKSEAKRKAAKERAKRERAEDAAALAAEATTPTESISTDPVTEVDTDDGASPGLVLLGGGAIAVLLAVGGNAAFRRFRGRTDA